MARSRNHFAVQTTFLCVIIYLHVTVSYIKLLSLNNKAYMVNLCSRQQSKLYVPVFEGKCILIHLHSFHSLHINIALKQKEVLIFC